ncbi:MAG: alpha/beta hydrolase [Sandaracinaceae bacterium]|nr:alpha/beta hydrolase [Sandaracinaceae bacterium]
MKPFEPMRFEALPERPRRPHRFFEIEDERVSVTTPALGTLEVSVRRAGRGDPLVLVHGLMTSSYSFRYVIDRLAEDYEVLVFDLPGAGRSSVADAPLTPDALAGFIGETMATLGVRGARVVGNSMGGYLCMRLAMKDPGAMSRLVNLHSPGLATPRMWALETAMRLPGAASVLDLLVRRDPLRWAFRNVHYYDESLKSLEEAREYGGPLMTPDGRRAFHSYLAHTLKASEMKRFEAELAALDGFPIPLQLLYVRRDPMVPPVVGERLARAIPDAEMVWLSEGSHFAHVDAVDAFLAAARPFLAAG